MRRLWTALLAIGAAFPAVAWARSPHAGQMFGAILLYAVPIGAIGVGFVLGEGVLGTEQRHLLLGACVLAIFVLALLAGLVLGTGGGFIAAWMIGAGLVALGLSAGVAAMLRVGFADPAGRSILLYGVTALVGACALALTAMFGFGGGSVFFAALTCAPFAAWATAARRASR